jgi:MFS family permease
VEGVTGIGLIIGPLLGGFLYAAVGFSTVFFILGSVVVLMSLVFLCAYPTDKKDQLLPDETS